MELILELAQRLEQRIASGLPGPIAHIRMAPLTRPVKVFEPEAYPDAKVGCVLALLYPKADTICLALIRRPEYPGVHSGQISFPGGKMEKDDDDHYSAALRETHEEIGVDKQHIHLIGALSHVYIPPSNFFVHPFLAYAHTQPEFQRDVHEVEEVLEMPISLLLEQQSKSTMEIHRQDMHFEVPCYVFGTHRIWGATAIILSELEMLLEA